jgi:hypothetical protein
VAFTITNYKNATPATSNVVAAAAAANDILIAYCTVDTNNSLTPGISPGPLASPSCSIRG